MTEKLQVTYRNVSDLIPYARNARTHSDEQVARIAASIKEFGWTNPILVDGENGIIAGHGRLQAARKLNLEKVPVIELAGLTETQKRAYILADNKLALDAGWDDDLLKIELEDLKIEDFDIELTGFSEFEIDTITDAIETQEDETLEGEDDESSEATGIIQYNIVFDDDAQQQTWFDFIKWLKNEYGEEEETLGSRLTRYLLGNVL